MIDWFRTPDGNVHQMFSTAFLEAFHFRLSVGVWLLFSNLKDGRSVVASSLSSPSVNFPSVNFNATGLKGSAERQFVDRANHGI